MRRKQIVKVKIKKGDTLTNKNELLKETEKYSSVNESKEQPNV